MPIGGIAQNWMPNSKDRRTDGSRKGKGWLGVLKRPDGNISTEISVGVNLDGQEVEIPLLVPTLSKDELGAILSADEKSPDFMNKLPPTVMQKAVEHARQRLMKGLSPFAD